MNPGRRQGAKKAAHYSAPDCAALPFAGAVRDRRVKRVRGAPLALFLLLQGMQLPAFAAPPASASRPEADARKAEAELQSVKAEIERITRQVSGEQVERDRMTRDLRDAEVSVGRARADLSDLKRQRAEHASRRAALSGEQHAREAQLAKNRAELAGQMRAAYLIGRQEPLKLLLNQEDPALAGRMFAYYGYFGHARAGQIKLIENDVQRLAELTAELDAEDAQLAALEQRRRGELSALEHARAQRSQVLVGLEAESRTRAQNLERLRSQQAGLEQLLRELRAAMERYPLEAAGAFAKLRGKLSWPVSGHLVARFGDTRAGGVRWDGVLVATERGSPVKAVCEGRVIYADWLPGLGLLAIIDHGDGYLSLYGHNERLYKAVGERVAAGEPLAAAGDSGGSGRPELYFEIRKGGKPVDPRPWFKASDP